MRTTRLPLFLQNGARYPQLRLPAASCPRLFLLRAGPERLEEIKKKLRLILDFRVGVFKFPDAARGAVQTFHAARGRLKPLMINRLMDLLQQLFNRLKVLDRSQALLKIGHDRRRKTQVFGVLLHQAAGVVHDCRALCS